MGSIGIPEIIVILLALALLVGPVIVIVGMVVYFSRKSKAAVELESQRRLAELDSLLAAGRITPAEYEEQRKRMSGGI